jgi:helicase MOV-10
LFEDYDTRHSFAIVRPVQAVVRVKDGRAAFQVTPPSFPNPAGNTEEDVVPGVPPAALAAIKWEVTLPKADIPSNVWAAIDQPSIAGTIHQVQLTLLPQVLQFNSYAKHWKSLLWLDEIQATSVDL